MTYELSLDEALHQVCSSCGEIFGMHRVTPSGTSYCLRLTHQATMDDKYLNREQVPLVLERVPVKMLIRSPFGKKLGLFVKGFFTSYLDEATA